ncbi:MAG: molybdenum cofactor biosynthesis protein MoaE [Candidatus Dormibacteria bacterium]|jgi:molybdopterin synthase catalytic subunit
MNGLMGEPASPPAALADIRVLCFGSLRERIGREVLVTLITEATVTDVWETVLGRCTGRPPSREGLRCARNLAYCSWDEPVQPGDELAFMPPVCGGSTDGGGVEVALCEDPIDASRMLEDAGNPADGAVACFVGRVRNHSDGVPVRALDYEAYGPMALARMHGIAQDARARHDLATVVILHRVGTLVVGDVAVLVVTTAAHRGPALDACREVIEAVKADVPIWKREHTAEGAHWVDARGASSVHV